MKSTLLILLIVSTLMVIAGPVSGEVTLQVGAAATQGNVYSTGNIYVDSSPPGASAILDGGAAQLFTPGTFASVPPGTHGVVIVKPGYQPYTGTVKVTTGTTQNVIVTLNRVSNPGGISVSSSPRGAALYVDDLYQGQTNQVVGNLAPGPHVVRISEAGYVAWSDTITVTPGDITSVSATLVAETNVNHGELQVSSSPSGAGVYVNGDYMGFTPPDDLLDIELSPGSYTVLVKKPGYQDYSSTQTIQAGKKVQVLATLQPGTIPSAGASAEVSSTPSGADVYVNNVYLGLTPLSLHNVTAGTYTIEIRLEGYNPFSTTGQVSPAQNIQIIAALSPAATPAPTKSPPGVLIPVIAIGIAGIVGIALKRD
ncbi:MAG: PEGA domain-containing protein [Methanolinea sp.]|nr:PEGA domain-containing protein [Methanolinea sp.]